MRRGPAAGLLIGVLAASFLAALQAAVRPAAADPLVVLVEQGDFAPYTMHVAGEFTGTDVEVLRAAAAKLGLMLEFREEPWARALSSIRANSADLLLSPIHTPERADFMLFAPEPISRVDVSIVDAGGSGWVPPAELATLDGRQVGVIRGYALGERFDQAARAGKFKVIETSSHLLLVNQLKAGRIDLAVSFEQSLRYDAFNAGLAEGLRFQAPPLQTQLQHVGLAKKPGYEDMARALGDAIGRMKTDGGYAAILKRFGLTWQWQPQGAKPPKT